MKDKEIKASDLQDYYEMPDWIKLRIKELEHSINARAEDLKKEFSDRFGGSIAFTNNDLAEFDRKIKSDPVINNCRDRIIELLNICPRKILVTTK